MQEKNYPLGSILASISTYKRPTAKKRIIYDASFLGGIGSKWLIVFFCALPFMEYAGIFNPWMFKMLGIAQAIIFYIVFLSMIMIVVFGLSFINNTKVVRQITPSWQHYFPNIDLNLVLSSGATPYKDFFKHYGQALNENLQEVALHLYLQEAFVVMQEENKYLLEAIAKNSTYKS